MGQVSCSCKWWVASIPQRRFQAGNPERRDSGDFLLDLADMTWIYPLERLENEMRMCSWLHMSIVDVCTVEAGKNLRATAHAADPKRVWNRARQGHIEVVRSLTEAGSDKDKSSNTGSTPLYIAAQNGHIEIVCFWTEAGSDNLGQGKVFCRRRQVRRDAPSSLGKWWYRWDGALAMWNFLWKSETLGFMFKVLFFQKDEMQFLFQSTWAG